MNILKFEILDLKSGDKVVKVEGQEIHVSRSSGEYVIYNLKIDKDGGIIDFDVFAILQGDGSFELIPNADLNDIADLWGGENE